MIVENNTVAETKNNTTKEAKNNNQTSVFNSNLEDEFDRIINTPFHEMLQTYGQEYTTSENGDIVYYSFENLPLDVQIGYPMVADGSDVYPTSLILESIPDGMNFLGIDNSYTAEAVIDILGEPLSSEYDESGLYLLGYAYKDEGVGYIFQFDDKDSDNPLVIILLK